MPENMQKRSPAKHYSQELAVGIDQSQELSVGETSQGDFSCEFLIQEALIGNPKTVILSSCTKFFLGNRKPLNLLDLPYDVLEMILSYCLRHEGDSCYWNISKLTEVNKFLKNFIESNNFLKGHLDLKVHVMQDAPDAVQIQKRNYKEILNACLTSTRKYQSIKIINFDVPITSRCYEGPIIIRNYDEPLYSNYVDIFLDAILDIDCYEDYVDILANDGEVLWSFEDANSGATVKQLFCKNASNIRRVTMYLETAINNQATFKLLNLIDSLDHLEEITLLICDEGSYANYNSHPNYIAPKNDFTRLKSLHMKVSNPFCGRAALELFQNSCRIEKLKLSLKFNHEIPVLRNLLRNCRGNLKEFKLDLQKCRTSSDYFDLLIESHLNLHSFQIGTRRETETALNTMVKFILSQKNLTELTVKFGRNHCPELIQLLGQAFSELKKLTTLTLNSVENADEYDLSSWNINNLDHFKFVAVYHENLLPDVRVCRSPSEKLKSLTLRSLKFSALHFQQMIQSYRGLTELSIRICDFMGSGIILIMRHLKQLKRLDFCFPTANRLDITEFYTQEDLTLPNIQSIELALNPFIGEGFFFKFVKFIQNVSVLSVAISVDSDNFYFRRGSDLNVALEILTKELPNLKYLNTEENLDMNEILLQEIKANLQKFNRNPNDFKLNGIRLMEEN